MSLVEEQIKDEFGKFAAQYGPATIKPAVVMAVNDDDTVAVQFSDDSTVDDARLKAVVKDGNKVLFVPKVGSNVLAGRIENSDEYVVISVEEISDIVFFIDPVSLEVSSDGVLIKKDTDTLKDALVTFVEAVETIIVLQGRNPDMVKLAEAKSKIQNILR